MDIAIHPEKVFAFDLDDTLYKEIEYTRSAFQMIAGEIDAENQTLLYIHMFSLFQENKDVFGYLEEHYPVRKADLIDQYRHHTPQLHLQKSASVLITQICEKGGKVGVITDGRAVTQRNKIKSLGLENKLNFLIISEETGWDKTSDHNFQLLEQKFPNHNYIYIADNPAKDFFHPNQRGWETIGVLDNGLNIHKQYIQRFESKMLPQSWIWGLEEIRLK